MNDSDTELVANDEDIENIVADSNIADILTPEASIYFVEDRNREKIRKTSWRNSNFSGDVILLLKLENNAILLERFATN